MFARGLDVKVNTIFRDKEGRVLILKMEMDNTTFLLCCVYAPNEDCPGFFQEIINRIEIQEFDLAIWGGDFNQVFDPKLDRKSRSRREDEKPTLSVELL